AVSKKLMPESTASLKCSRASSLFTCQPVVPVLHDGISPPPYVIVPKQSLDTVTPVLPSVVYFMDSEFTLGRCKCAVTTGASEFWVLKVVFGSVVWIYCPPHGRGTMATMPPSH